MVQKKLGEVIVKKKIFAFICCLTCMMYIFTGCALFEENQERKLNQVVASVGNVSVTLEQLLKSYSNNAETLSNNGYNVEQALEYCTKNLLVRGVVEEGGKKMLDEGKITITDYDKSEAVKGSVNYFSSLMDAYKDEVLKDMGLTSALPSNTDSSSSYTAETKFEAKYRYEVEVTEADGQKNYNLSIRDVEKEDSNPVVEFVSVYNHYMQGVDITTEYYKILDDSYVAEYGEQMKSLLYDKVCASYKVSYKQYANQSNQKIIVSEMTKILKEYVSQLYINKVSEYYNNLAKANVSASDLLKYYTDKYNASKSIYENNDTAYISAMLGDSANTYYNAMPNAFGFVTHVLLGFSEDQKALLSERKNQLSSEEYTLYESKLAQEIKVTAYDENGAVIKESVTPNEVLQEIKEDILSAGSFAERASAFNKYVYMYNSDPGIKNKETDYVIGRQIKEETESRSKMVTNFTDASRALIETYLGVQEGKDIATIKAEGKNKADIEAMSTGEYVGYAKSFDRFLDESTIAGELGSISGLVLTENGYHIIMFTGIPSSIEISDTQVKQKAKQKLLSLIKEADTASSLTISDIEDIFSNEQIKAMALSLFTTNAHTTKTILDEAMDSAIGKLVQNYSNSLYSNYVISFKDSDKKYTLNKGVYSYLLG